MGRVKKKLPSWIVLCAVCLCAVVVLLLANGLTAGRIRQQAEIAEQAPRIDVLETASEFRESDWQSESYALDSLYEGLDADGATVGYVGQTTVDGYRGPVEVLAGVDANGVITGVRVGGEAFDETPGLGALTREAACTDQFKGLTPDITLNEDVDSVSAATITSRAVTNGVNTIASCIYADKLGMDKPDKRASAGGANSATEKGFAGDVTATIEFNADNTIKALTIDTPDETEGLGKRCSEEDFTSQFIGKTGPFTYGEDGIEAVSGATFTSTAAINAINAVVSGGGQSGESGAVTVQGFGGDVTLHAELNEDGTVASLTIDTPNETDGLGKRASEEAFTAQFIGKAGPFTYGEDGIEALTGATVTSTAVLAGLNSLYAQEPAAEAPVEEPAAEEPVEEEAPAEAAEVGALADGTYTASKDTGFSVIDVTLTVAGGKIAEGKVESSGASDLLTDDQRSAWSTQIVDTQGAEVDAVTGVTISSNAVKEAVEELLAQAAAGEAAELEPAA